MPAVPPRLPRTRRTVTRNDTGHTDMPQGRQHRPHSSNQPIAVKTHALLADPGLYAVGNTAGNAFGRTYPGAGATIGQGLTFGYVAARHAAGLL